MCMEDIQIGRSMRGKLATLAVPDVTATPLVAADPKRVRLVVGSRGGIELVIGTSATNVALGVGLSTGLQTPLLVLRIEDIGLALCDAWFISGNGAAGQATVIDLNLERE